MIYFLIICLCTLGFSSGENQTDVTNITTTATNPVTNEEAFEVFSLNSYSYDNPLIIRSRIPESVKPSPQDIKQNVADKSLSATTQHESGLSANSQYSLPLPYFNDQPSGKINPGIEVLPTVSIPSISDLSALLYADSPYAVGLTSFESSAPAYYSTPIEPLFSSEPIPLLPILTPAQLQFSNSWNPTEAKLKNVNSQPILKSQSDSHPDFLIEKVPEVASFSKSGQFSVSDIPSLTELESIFKNSTTEEIKIDSRIGTQPEDVNTTTDVIETTTVQPFTEFPGAIDDIKSNTIDNDENESYNLVKSLRTHDGDNDVQGNVSIWSLISDGNEETTTSSVDITTVVTENAE